jgi:hypothetical protein
MSPDDRHTEVSEATRQAEAQEARSAHNADRPASPDEGTALNEESVDQDVREHYEDMAARGVAEKGEGRIP